jgi:hypothetical protein
MWKSTSAGTAGGVNAWAGILFKIISFVCSSMLYFTTRLSDIFLASRYGIMKSESACDKITRSKNQSNYIYLGGRIEFSISSVCWFLFWTSFEDIFVDLGGGGIGLLPFTSCFWLTFKGRDYKNKWKLYFILCCPL